jgi:hypothetical protein
MILFRWPKRGRIRKVLINLKFSEWILVWIGRRLRIHCCISRIRKGEPVVIPILSINRSKELWGEDANEFKCVSPQPSTLPFIHSLTADPSDGGTFPKPSPRSLVYGLTFSAFWVVRVLVSVTGSLSSIMCLFCVLCIMYN